MMRKKRHTVPPLVCRPNHKHTNLQILQKAEKRHVRTNRRDTRQPEFVLQ